MQGVQGRDRVGIEEGSVGTGPAGSVFGENSFYRVPGDKWAQEAKRMHARTVERTNDRKAKSSIPALSYFQDGGIKHEQDFYAKVSFIPSGYAKGALCGPVGTHRAPI